MLRKTLFNLCTILLLCAAAGRVYAQPGWTVDPFGKEKKPAQYEDKILASEKTEDKKFGGVRKVIQNTTSHYNFFFNANNKINGVVERAKMSHKDDYSKLLSFYPYSLDNTASQKTDLDSVIYKATAGILLHDLRSQWVDNFYLLIGEAYFYKKDFDSAALTFQFINYNLFPRKKNDDDYDKIVGTNDAANGVGSVTIADKEKRNFLQKAFTIPPSRNDALLWQVRTFIEQQQYGDAAGLISILNNDRNLPPRLRNDLEEVTAYWFYAQNNLDSSAVHLQKALSNADDKEDKSRWEYLLGQLYENGGKYELASTYFNKAAAHTNDPVMDIYARLNDATMLRNSGNIKELDNSISNLLKMAHRDKYSDYRDIIYYSAAKLSLEHPDTTGGIGYYAKSINYNNPTSGYRDKSYLELADIAYRQHRYKAASAYYDSVHLTGKENFVDPKMVADRKEVLGRLVPLLDAVDREDSLQMLASLSPAERDARVKKILKNYRKANGLKGQDDDFAGNTLITFNDPNKAPAELFPSNGAATGDWYFYNATLRSRGFNDFRTKWGKRENVDNWRRKTASEAAVNKERTMNANPDAADPDSPGGGKPLPGNSTVIPVNAKPTEFTYDGLMANVPLSADLMDSSNSRVEANLYAASLLFQNELEDYPQAINSFNDFIRRFPQSKKLPDVYFDLAYCYGKIGNPERAAYYKNLLIANYAGSNAAKTIQNPAAFKPHAADPAVTARYADIYNMYIEGNFEQAEAAKRSADSSYGKNYWSPQLLYIEAVYYIKQRKDSNAIAALRSIQTLYPASPLKARATTMIDVLGRRAQIEQYLTNLQVTRETEETVIVPDDSKPPVAKVTQTAPSTVKVAAPAVPKKLMTDSIKAPTVLVNKSFTLEPERPQQVVMILDKVDPVYINEAKNAFTRFNRESSETMNLTIARDTLDPSRALLIFAPFDNAAAALKYFDKIKRAAPNEISWLQPTKYSFIVISGANLQLLKSNKDLPAYRELINRNFGNRF